MSRRTHVSIAARFALAAWLAGATAAWAGPEVPGAAGRYAITGATVHTVTRGDVPNATLVFENGRIVSIEANGAVPAGAKVIDQKGRHVYPGFIDANTQLGLIEVGTVTGANDTQEVGNVNPNLRAEVMVNPDSDLLPVARVNGVTSALVIPGGGAIHGLSALLHLDGWTQEDMTVQRAVALHVNWPNMTPQRAWWMQQSDEDQNRQRDEAIAAIRSAFDDARAYEKARAAEGAAGVPKHDADTRWDAMRRVVRGEVPVWFHADHVAQIRALLAFVDEQKLTRVAIVGGRDAWMLAPELKARDIAVIVAGTEVMPGRRWDAYDEAFALPGKLAAAGVRFCIASQGGGFSAANVRNLPHHAGFAAAFGLPREEALKAVTLYPAQIVGAGDRLGSIEPGKIADLQITDGDPLETTTQCLAVFIAGRPVEMSNRQVRLFQKYDARPRGPHARAR
ncbi:MAG: amidohydrolase family protein [Candidatus Eisenbacteria bacterium]|uniref:Amidohydrolase family protein n=1 Tax=Eiseniibacteriota bacterium TaxID=2212470 RepID=A0A933SHT1_UNCEI|nr:amidohydrolase family protein [Candidatus Eisenbacteria bacterium]